MSDERIDDAGGLSSPSEVPSVLRELADHWGLVLAYGLVTFGLGVVLMVWPGETLTVVAVLVAIQLLFSGIMRIVIAVSSDTLDGGYRALMGLAGAVALIVGLLCLRDPLQTLLALGIILGAWWVVSGVVDLLGFLFSRRPGRRAWDLVGPLVSILAGGFLLVNPDLSLGLLVIVSVVWLIAVGLLAVISAFVLRSERGSSGLDPSPAQAAPGT